MNRSILSAVLALASFPLLAEEAPPAPAAPKNAGDASEQERRDRRMEEVAQARAAKLEQNRILGEHYLAEGRRLKQENRLEDAAVSLRRAAELIPESAEVRQELREVDGALGNLMGRREVALDELNKAHTASEDEKTVFVQHRIREGQRLMGEQRFAEALQILREAQETVRWMAFGSADQERLRAEVATLTKEAQRSALEEEVRLKERQRAQAAVEAQKDYEAIDRKSTRLNSSH